jgi:hypothetical protein
MERRLSAIAVYCGSSPGADPVFADVARQLGTLLAQRRVELVYGGGHVGLMGTVADAVLAGGGSVHGVITRALEAKEVAHTQLTSLQVVSTMHERKSAMADRADAFCMLPGGFGTFDEFFEAVTWTQLGIHAKPCGVLNVGGFYDPLVELLDAATRERFLLPAHRDMVLVASDPEAMVDRLSSWVPLVVDKWLDRAQR